MSIDIPWAREQLAEFLTLTHLHYPPRTRSAGPALSDRQHTNGSEDEIVASAHVVEQILDRVLPRWRTEIPNKKNATVNRWCQHREAALRADAALQHDAEVRARLGDDAPQLSAGSMHPWAWEGAQALWRSGHYREAVTAAARKVNAETQNKVGRRDVSETGLFQQAFTLDDPKPGQPRLRLMTDDGSATYSSLHRGAMALAEGCYAGIRNPSSHEDGQPELSEHEALEQLAAFSILARWVDTADLVTA